MVAELERRPRGRRLAPGDQAAHDGIEAMARIFAAMDELQIALGYQRRQNSYVEQAQEKAL